MEIIIIESGNSKSILVIFVAPERVHTCRENDPHGGNDPQMRSVELKTFEVQKCCR